jgi:hypothetical protein
MESVLSAPAAEPPRTTLRLLLLLLLLLLRLLLLEEEGMRGLLRDAASGTASCSLE